MNKFLKWFGIILGTIVLLLTIVVLFLYSSVNSRLEQTYKINIKKIVLPTDLVSIEKGKHRSLLCQGCHGDDLSGKVVFSSDAIGAVIAPNLTSGVGGIGRIYSNEDWVRVITHGVKKNGKPVLIMPSEDFQNFSQEDLYSIVAYLKTISPVNNKPEKCKLTIFGKLLVSLGAFGNVINAETINHKNNTNIEDVQVASDIKFGKYIVGISGCRHCHGKGLNGGKNPNPDSPPGSNLTSGGNLAKWSESDFINTIRTGKTPEGKILNPVFMPWIDFCKMNEVELSAIYKYLKSLPPKETIKG
ncbi:MAG: hypothetical protein EPN82_04650 [Bacteroidetes bacterium]|nr:MAG: hypothetical protein EPN82_04650 [Bacteroidota bacterium]